VLATGDLIWVSAASAAPKKDSNGNDVKTSGYDSSAVVPGKPISLRLQQEPLVQGALASIEPENGDVVALIGGYSFGESHLRRPGASRVQASSPLSIPQPSILASRHHRRFWMRRLFM
jgi:penicillin-binding protein 1A